MISLSTTTQTLEVVLGSAPTTALRSAVSFGEHTVGSYAAKNQTASISGTSAVTILSAPAAGYERVVRGFSLQNIDSASATITVRLNDNGTYTTLIKVTILSGYLLTYDDDGWAVINDTGARLGVGPTGATGAAGAAGATGPQGPEGGTTTLTTKGDILTRDASNLARLPVGSNGQYLQADSSTTTGLLWTTPPTGAPASAQYVTLALDGGLSSERVLTAGSNISITDGGANGNVTIAASGLATNTPQYVTLAATADLTNERVLTAGSGISITDAGAGSTVTIAASGLATNTPQYVTLSATGDLTNERILTAGTGIAIADGGAGSAVTISTNGVATNTPQFLTLAATGDLVNERVFTAGTGISVADAGAGSTYTVSVNQGALTHNNLDGLTTGDPHTQYLLKSTVTTAGDLLYGTGSATITRLGIGSAGQVLTVSSGLPTWSTPSPGVTDHGALTGLADDDHTKYIFSDPGSSARNVITPGGDFKALVIKGSAGQTVNLMEGQLSAGTVRFSVSSTGNVTGYGFDSSNRAITNVADPTSAQDCATKNYVDGLVGGAPVGASYVVIGSNATLTSERVLTAGSGITITDGGANGNVTIAASGGGGGAEAYLLFQAGIF